MKDTSHFYEVERRARHARFRGDRFTGHAQNALQVDAEIENHRRAEALAGQTGASPARNHRQVVLEAIAHEDRDIIGVGRHGHRQWRDLERTGIGGIQPARQRIEVQIPTELAAKIIGDLLFVQHESRVMVSDQLSVQTQPTRPAGDR